MSLPALWPRVAPLQDNRLPRMNLTVSRISLLTPQMPLLKKRNHVPVDVPSQRGQPTIKKCNPPRYNRKLWMRKRATRKRMRRMWLSGRNMLTEAPSLPNHIARPGFSPDFWIPQIAAIGADVRKIARADLLWDEPR